MEKIAMSTLKNLTALIALSLASSSFAQVSQAGLINPGFEEPRVKERTYTLVKAMPGWKTNDKEFEIWNTEVLGVTPHEGAQFVEINAWIAGTLYQDVTGIQSGSMLDFTFAHRGRNGDDTMKFSITDLGADNAIGGGDDTELYAYEYSSGNDEWSVYGTDDEMEIKALGNTVRFAYQAISAAGGNPGQGNLLDAANFGIKWVSMQPALAAPALGAPLTIGLGDAVTIEGKLFAEKFYTSADDPKFKGETAFLPIILVDRKLAFKLSALDEGFLHGPLPAEPVDRIELMFNDPSLLAEHEKSEGKPARIQGSLIIDQDNRLLPVKFEVYKLEILEPAG